VLAVAGLATIALVGRSSSERQLDVIGPTSSVPTVAPSGPATQTPATSEPTPPVSPDTPQVVSIGVGADPAGSSLVPGRYSITLDGIEVEFTLDRGIDIVEITDDQFVLGAPPLDENSAAILVTLASVTPIFDPGDPENRFEDAGVSAAVVGCNVPGIRSDALILRPRVRGLCCISGLHRYRQRFRYGDANRHHEWWRDLPDRRRYHRWSVNHRCWCRSERPTRIQNGCPRLPQNPHPLQRTHRLGTPTNNRNQDRRLTTTGPGMSSPALSISNSDAGVQRLRAAAEDTMPLTEVV